jgi:hypothetical protein
VITSSSNTSVFNPGAWIWSPRYSSQKIPGVRKTCSMCSGIFVLQSRKSRSKKGRSVSAGDG